MCRRFAPPVLGRRPDNFGNDVERSDEDPPHECGLLRDDVLRFSARNGLMNHRRCSGLRVKHGGGSKSMRFRSYTSPSMAEHILASRFVDRLHRFDWFASLTCHGLRSGSDRWHRAPQCNPHERTGHRARPIEASNEKSEEQNKEVRGTWQPRQGSTAAAAAFPEGTADRPAPVGNTQEGLLATILWRGHGIGSATAAC